MKPQSWGESSEEHRDLTARIQSGEASPKEHERFQDLIKPRGQAILGLPLEQLFDVQKVEPCIPTKARVREAIPCEACGEMVMETRIRLLGGRKLCIPCFEVRERRL